MICELQNRSFIHHSRHFTLQSCDFFFNEVKTKILWGEGCQLDQFLERKSALQAVRLVSAVFKHHVLRGFYSLKHSTSFGVSVN